MLLQLTSIFTPSVYGTITMFIDTYCGARFTVVTIEVCSAAVGVRAHRGRHCTIFVRHLHETAINTAFTGIWEDVALACEKQGDPACQAPSREDVKAKLDAAAATVDELLTS